MAPPVEAGPTRLMINWNMLVNGSDTNYFDFWKLKDH
jgi:hypothetical protein